jgi:hypothetical protein
LRLDSISANPGRATASQRQRHHPDDADVMPFTAKDLDAYRRDERLGHKLLTPEERIKLLRVRARRIPRPSPRPMAHRG